MLVEKAKKCNLDEKYIMEIQNSKISDIDELNYHQLEPHFYNQWKEKVEDMQIFENIEDPHEWYINKQNAALFLDSLDIDVKYIDSFEFMNLVGLRTIEFHSIVIELIQLLVFTKKIKFDQLINFEDF